MNKLVCFVFLSFLISVLSSCATMVTGQQPIQPLHPKSSLHWQAQGKISMQTQGKAETASLDWQQDNRNYQVRLFGPLGLGAVEINGSPGEAELIDSHGQIHQADSAEDLSRQILGYPLPMADLVYWLKGVKTKHHHGWTIRYLSYHQNGMPKLITASHQGINLRIFIDKWQFF